MNPRPQTAPAQTATVPPSGVDEPRRRSRYWFAVAGVALVLMLVVRGFLVQSFYIPSASMEPTLRPGDRILVNKLVDGASLQRGDVVVFDGTHTFAADPPETAPTGAVSRVVGATASLFGMQRNESDFVKRIIGLPGDRVVCCTAQGQLSVNGSAVDEPYLYPGDKPSALTFDVIVPPDHLWVMGDHRSDSADSRAHLGDPGGGMVSRDDVIGRASVLFWPLDRLGVLHAPAGLTGIPAGTGASR